MTRQRRCAVQAAAWSAGVVVLYSLLPLWEINPFDERGWRTSVDVTLPQALAYLASQDGRELWGHHEHIPIGMAALLGCAVGLGLLLHWAGIRGWRPEESGDFKKGPTGNVPDGRVNTTTSTPAPDRIPATDRSVLERQRHGFGVRILVWLVCRQPGRVAAKQPVRPRPPV